MSPRRRFGVLLSALLLWALADFPAFSLAPADRQRLESRTFQEWEVEVSAAEGRGGLRDATRLQVARALNATGFAVLRGASIFTQEELRMARNVAEEELAKVKEATKLAGLLDRAPWIKGTYSIEKLFEFEEALCYSQGRLDMPKLLDTALKSSRWCGHPDLRGITELCFAATAQQTVLGALWNFPGSGPPVWHRDGGDQLLVAVTAPTSYPETVGFIHGQPQTHQGAAQAESPGPKSPDASLGEFDVPLPLKCGETLLFWYSTKHAATPNLSELERCLIYSVHGPVGVSDQQNHKVFLPSIFNITAEDARGLDRFYQRQGYLLNDQGSQSVPGSFPLIAGIVLIVFLACLALQR